MSKEVQGEHKEPRIIILDIDGTFFGSVEYYVQRWYIQDYINSLRKSGAFSLGSILATSQPVSAFPLDARVVRPGFVQFIREMSATGVHFFIYTAGGPEWVNYIIPKLEASYDIKFCRPFFTRTDCVWGPAVDASLSLSKKGGFTGLTIQGAHGVSHVVEQKGGAAGLMYLKSLKLVWPRLISALASQYPILRTEAGANHVFEKNLMFVDNTANVLMDSREKQLVCPTYNYVQFFDVLEGFDKDVLNNKMVREFIRLQNVTLPGSADDPMEDLVVRYTSLATKALEAYNTNKGVDALKDTFWIDLLAKMKLKKNAILNAATIKRLIPSTPPLE